MILDDKFCMTKENLFFELIQVAIGVRSCLSLTPNESEWEDLYAMAQKQSLIGVCFAGIQRLGADADEGFTRIGMGEMLYLTWMGMTAKIQQKNEVVNRQCVLLGERLKAEGYRYCILKGQGVGLLYAGHLRGLRQSGDIDVWIDGGVDAVVTLAESMGQKAEVTEQHVHLDVFEETEVEAHFTPSMLRNPMANRRLQKLFKEQANACFENKVSLMGMSMDGKEGKTICVPIVEFNLMYLLIHIYRHLFGEGVGLRQLMDYYWALYRSPLKGVNPDSHKNLKSLGLYDFAGAVMYVLREVFGMERSLMLCEPNERHGKFLLNEIMIAGNMGHHDERLKEADRSTRWKRFWMMNKHNMRLISYYPAETLWAPFTRVKIWAWRKRKGYL